MAATQRSKRVIHARPGSLAREALEEGLAEQEKNDIPPPAFELRKMIAVAAYYRSARRGFEPGQELADWLAAEKEINDLYGL